MLRESDSKAATKCRFVKDHGTEQDAMQNDNPDRQPADVLQAVQDALLLHPPDVQEPTILSTAPSMWNEGLRVIDVSRVLRVASTVSRASGPELEREVARAFQTAGWPAERIAKEYRPDLKSRDIIDVALLVPDGQCVVAVEVKLNTGTHFPRRVRDARFHLQAVAPNVEWHCVTDGNTYYLRNTTTDKAYELHGAFSAEALASADFSRPSAGTKCVPESFPELASLLNGAGWVVLDQSIAAVRLETGNSTRTLLEEALGRSLPGSTDLVQALLSWVGEREGIAWVSALCMAAMLRGESSQWLRTQLGSRYAVRAIIEVGGVLPGVQPSARFCIIHLGYTTGPAYLASSDNPGGRDLEETVRAAKHFFDGQKPSRGFIADVDRNGRWAVSLYDPELDKVEQRLASIGRTKPLSEVCAILRGLSLTLHPQHVGDGVPLVTRISQLDNPDGEDVRRIRVSPEVERFVLQPGDLVVPSIKSGSRQCVMIHATEAVVASDHLFIMRVTDNSVTPEYLLEYLNSSTARRLLDSRYAGSGTMMLNTRSLGSLPVPVLERPLALDLRQIGALESSLRQRADDLRTRRGTLFEAAGADVFYAGVQDLLRDGELLSRSIVRSDELGFQVANFYPFPIAYGYRLLASITNSTDLYKEQLRAGENILVFLASVAMSLVQPSDRASVELDVKKIWDGGASPGHWRDITGRCCKVLSTYKDHPLAASIVGLQITSEKRGFGMAAKKIITAKNDFKHDRGPKTDEELVSACKDFQETLQSCIKALGFFTEYPIRQVVDHDVTRNGDVLLRCLALVGDHPGLPQEEVRYDKPLHKLDLYIDAGSVGWVALFPLLVARNCPSCKTRETFFLDKWDRDAGTSLRKSFERGHVEETKEVVEHMAPWLAAARSGGDGRNG
jgi:hypothetical protein